MGYTVSIPLTDSQDYDLVVEIDGVLKKVQVKTTSGRQVELRLTGGNTKVNKIHKLANEIEYDYLFVLSSDGDQYFIPKVAFAEHKASINLCEKYTEFKI